MTNSTLGFTFKEVMAGGFALGASDPCVGEAAGRAACTTLTMHASILIEDLDKFFADALHPGSISGQIDYPPLGVQLPATSGVFRLFSPTEDPAMKYMVYELGFHAGGESYYMAGHKEVKRAPVMDMWHATTTLYTRLHKGNNATNPIIAAGILSLSMHNLLGMIPTLKALNANSPEQAAGALTKFGRFFFGELWDTYLSKVGA